MSKRLQLTLFVPPQYAADIEQCRRTVNPAQYALIAAHVTLCREDELININKILENLAHLSTQKLCITFGNPVRFSDEKGVLLPALGENTAFQALRTQILSGIIENPRLHAPHITLLHPRNATCTNSIFENITQNDFPTAILFDTISLIEQEIGQKWHVLEKWQI